MTDLTRWPLIADLVWFRDSLGYEIRDGFAVRLGGDLVPVNLGAHPGLHNEFLSFDRTVNVVGFNDDGEPLDAGDLEGDLLQFVNRYGLLGVDGDPSTDRDSIQKIMWARTRMGVYTAFAHDDLLTDPQGRASMFNQSCPAAFQAVLEVEGGRSTLKLRPVTLLAWMWLQLAKEIDGGVRTKACPNCGTRFEVDSEDKRRKRRAFCSQGCQVNFWKKRKRKAESVRQARGEIGI